MSRRHQNKKQRKARRERIAAERKHAFEPLPPGTSSWGAGEMPFGFSFTARGGTRLDLLLAGPSVFFDPESKEAPPLHEMVLGEMLRNTTGES